MTAYVGVPLVLVETDGAHASAVLTQVELRRNPFDEKKNEKIRPFSSCFF